MDIEFDPAKDAMNVAKHGLSLTRAWDMEEIVVVRDTRFEEERYRLYGLIDGLPHCAAVALRNDRVRIINLRRAHRKEYGRHG